MSKHNFFVRLRKKWRFRYKLSITNKKTLENVFQVELSRTTAFLFSFFALLIVFVAMSLLILYSPIKYYLPGFSDYSLRGELTAKFIELDSLEKSNVFQGLQLEALKNIMEGNIKTDSIASVEDIDVEKWEKLAAQKSEKEKQFVKNYEKSMLKIAKKESEISDANQHFSSPIVGGIIVRKPDVLGISIVGKAGQNVLSIANGTVVISAFSSQNSYIVVIQHPDNYLSCYYNLSKPLVSEGATIDRDEVIATVDNSDKNNPQSLYFEIWHNGRQINPTNVIIF